MVTFLSFFQPRFKESSVYLARFKQCLSKALNLIKIHVVTILQNATQQVTPKKVSIDVSLWLNTLAALP